MELIDRCKAGDPQAWEYIVRLYSRRIYNLAYKFTGKHESAEDLTQEVFIKIYRSLNQYDAGIGELSSWLMRLARNLIIDDYRKRQRRPNDSSSESIDEHIYHLRLESDTPQRRVERKERSLQIRAAIDKLSPELRECVVLRDIEGLSYQEIVARLQIPEGTVKSRINRGRIELAKVLHRMKVV